MKEGMFAYSASDEIFGSALYETKEEAIKEAKQEGLIGYIYVGVVKGFDKKVLLGDFAIEQLSERVYEECGIEDYLYDVKNEKIDKLDNMLWEAFEKWLKEEGEDANHYKIVDIEKIELEQSETGSRA